ncbi:hypothetical protein N0V82_002750 [Gnomoniopsis sp. IMI 355080]|nr:hypothetical protein N0V82_002750 [Gnomoniopsis sp. IMI 355080]
MSQDYSEEDDFDGFSDQDGSQVYIYDEVSEAASEGDDESKRHDGFFDDEASEAESEAESDAESGTDYDPSGAITPNALHNFMHLPLELRQMIWKSFCPDLSNEPRLYEISFCGRWPHFAAWVEDQTAPLRTVLAVHQESRALGHKFAPHLIQLFSDCGVAPCNLERDIVLVDWVFDHRYSPEVEEIEMLAKIAPGLQNLAIRSGVTLFDGAPDLDRLYSLKNVFVSMDTGFIPTRGLTWCLSEKNNSYHVVHQEDVGAGLTRDVDMLFLWPDPEKYGESGERTFSSRSFGSLKLDEEGLPVTEEGERHHDSPGLALNISNWGYEIARLREWLDPLHELTRPEEESWEEQSHSGSSGPETGEQVTEETLKEEHEGKKIQGNEETTDIQEQSSPPRPQRISVWPLARFEDSEVQRIDTMKAWQKPWEEWDTTRGSDSSEQDWSDDDDPEYPDSLDGFITWDDTMEPEADDDEILSQPEDEEAASNRSNADEEESSTETGEPSRARQRNRVVVDLADSSEEEEDEDDTTALQRAGSSNRRARARAIPVDSDDDEDDDLPHPSRRPIPVNSDDDDDDDDDLPQPSRAGARRAAVVLSDSDDDEEDLVEHQNGKVTIEDDESSSEEGEDISDEEEAPPPRISLAKRLRMEAAQARAEIAAMRAAECSDEEDEDQGDGASYDEEHASDGDDAEDLGSFAEYNAEDEDESQW